MKYKKGDKLEIVSNGYSMHQYNIGDIVEVIRIFNSNGKEYYDTCNKTTGNCWTVDTRDVKLFSKYTKTKQMTKTFKDQVFDAATKLLKANNTVTTLEIKTELRTNHLVANQDDVSKTMIELEQEGKFTYVDNGTYRIYSDVQTSVPQTKTQLVNSVTSSRVSRRKALDLIRNSKGHFFTVEFMKQEDNTLRTMNCQYLSGQDIDPLGLVKVKEASKLKLYNKLIKEGKKPKKDYIRSFNMSSLKSLSIGGQILKIRK